MPSETDGDDSRRPGRLRAGEVGSARRGAAGRGIGGGTTGPAGTDADVFGRVLSFVRPDRRQVPADPLALRSAMARLAALSVRIVAEDRELYGLLRRLLARADGVRLVDDGPPPRRSAPRRPGGSADAILLAADLEPKALLTDLAARMAQPEPGVLIVVTESTDPALDVAAIAAGAADLLQVEELDTERLQRAIRLAVARSLLRPTCAP